MKSPLCKVLYNRKYDILETILKTILKTTTPSEVRFPRAKPAPFWRTVLYFDAAKTNPWPALRNSIEYEQALYQANAGVQHVLSQLETDVTWRGTATGGSYPASGSYSATAANGAISGTVDVTSAGVAGSIWGWWAMSPPPSRPCCRD